MNIYASINSFIERHYSDVIGEFIIWKCRLVKIFNGHEVPSEQVVYDLVEILFSTYTTGRDF